MSDYLFGSFSRSIGEVNGLPVILRTENGKTTAKIGGRELSFSSRKDALNYLRNMANKPKETEKGQFK